jgi:hypothetical protein
MKNRNFHDFGDNQLISIKKKSAKKLSTASAFLAA